MINHELNELMNKISSLSDLSQSEKEALLSSCKTIKETVQTMTKEQAEDIKQTKESLTQLQEFEINHPTISHCIDILARTLSRIGI